MDLTYHYPPELFELLVETIPRLCRSKKATIQFFRGAGVNSTVFLKWESKVRTDKESVNKFEIARAILTDVNERGEPALRERREVLKRVVEFEDFSRCWDNDRLAAKGLVAEVRNVVNVKDSFTKIRQAQEEERKKRKEEHEAQTSEIKKKQEELDAIKAELYPLFTMDDPHKRGKLLEGILNRLFQAFGIIVRESFELVGDTNEGIIEQIDGVIEIDGYLYLVEMKWWKNPLGKSEVAPHLVRVFNRGHAGGLLISASGYTEPAILDCKEALSQKIIVLSDLEEIVNLLENRANLKDFIKAKINIAIIEKKPYHKILRL